MVKTVFEQTGWRGLCAVSICQDIDILQAITEYDYDLHDIEFEKYCVSRFGHSRAAYPPAFEHICDYGMSKKVWFDHYRKNEVGTIFPDDDLETLWQGRKIRLGKYQQCWELFRAECEEQ